MARRWFDYPGIRMYLLLLLSGTGAPEAVSTACAGLTPSGPGPRPAARASEKCLPALLLGLPASCLQRPQWDTFSFGLCGDVD